MGRDIMEQVVVGNYSNNSKGKMNACLVIFILASYLVLGCTRYDKYNKDNHIVTYKIVGLNVYGEIFNVAGYGVYGGDVESVYLTDSMNYRKYVGEKYDNQKILFSVDGNFVIGRKIEINNGNKILINEYIFDLHQLEIQGGFD